MSAQERSIGLDPELYTVVWIAPIEIEARAALQALDHYHCGHFKWERGQDYLFHAGDINRHNVVIATLPIGQNPSTAAAASLASTVKIHFPNIQFGFLVGYASGLPNLSLDPPQDIRLGDVIVGIAEEETAGVVAYDWGTETENGFELFDGGFALATTASIVRAAVGMISIWSRADMERVLPFYNEIRDRDADGLFHDPGQAEDNLYAVDQDGVEYIVQRDRRPDNMRSWAWYGPIGSGDKLFRDSEKRDKMRDKYNLLGLEIGAAGIMNTIPVGVIRGVSDYGDQHNDKLWQPYAAAMAAAYTKAILNEICPRKTPINLLSGYRFKTEEDYMMPANSLTQKRSLPNQKLLSNFEDMSVTPTRLQMDQELSPTQPSLDNEPSQPADLSNTGGNL